MTTTEDFTDEQWAELIDAARKAALAMAHLWDVMNPLEQDGWIFDGTGDLVCMLAAEVPGGGDDDSLIADDDIKELIRGTWKEDQ